MGNILKYVLVSVGEIQGDYLRNIKELVRIIEKLVNISNVITHSFCSPVTGCRRIQNARLAD